MNKGAGQWRRRRRRHRSSGSSLRCRQFPGSRPHWPPRWRRQVRPPGCSRVLKLRLPRDLRLCGEEGRRGRLRPSWRRGDSSSSRPARTRAPPRGPSRDWPPMPATLPTAARRARRFSKRRMGVSFSSQTRGRSSATASFFKPRMGERSGSAPWRGRKP